MAGNPVVLVNRIGENLSFVCDSRHYVLTPGENFGYDDFQAQFAMRQNPVMGSEDYHSLEFTSMVGIKGATDCDPIDDETLLRAYDSVERFDRATAGLAPVKTMKHAFKPRGRTAELSSGAGTNAFAVASL